MGDVPPLDEETLLAWSHAWGLGHSRDRIAELLPAVNAQIGDLAALWQVDVADYPLVPTPPAWKGERP